MSDEDNKPKFEGCEKSRMNAPQEEFIQPEAIPSKDISESKGGDRKKKAPVGQAGEKPSGSVSGN